MTTTFLAVGAVLGTALGIASPIPAHASAVYRRACNTDG
jgi:hypothetical protein